MPTVEASRAANLNQRVKVQQPSGAPVRAINAPPTLPANLSQSTVMISSLPSIATSVDGIIRQFYGSGRLPTRRLTLPS